MVDDWSFGAHDALLPWHCACCGAKAPCGFELCGPCFDALPWNDQACPRCALPQSRRRAPRVCRECRRDPPPFARVIAPFRYAFPIDRLILGLKFGGKLEHGRLLARLLTTRLAVQSELGVALLPMPLHRSRLAVRGFNQAAELARGIAPALGAHLQPDLACRIRATLEQTRLGAAARRRNLAGAFLAARGPSRVLVVDDVVTTGATVRELSATLRAAGSDQVVILAVARVGG